MSHSFIEENRAKIYRDLEKIAIMNMKYLINNQVFSEHDLAITHSPKFINNINKLLNIIKTKFHNDLKQLCKCSYGGCGCYQTIVTNICRTFTLKPHYHTPYPNKYSTFGFINDSLVFKKSLDNFFFNYLCEIYGDNCSSESFDPYLTWFYICNIHRSETPQTISS